MSIVSFQKENTPSCGIKNASVKVTGEAKLDGSVLNRETAIEDYDLIRLGSSRKGSGVAYFMKPFVTYMYKANLHLKRKVSLQRYI